MKTMKKFGGLLLSLVLVMSMLAVVAFAEAPAGFPAGYEELEIEWTELHYYNSVKSEDPISGLNDGSGDWWYCTQKFTREDLPNGTVIVAYAGAEYQAEGWVNGELNETKNRPRNLKLELDAETSYVVIDDAWWNVTEKVTNSDGTVSYNPINKVFTERGFNVRVYPIDPNKGLKADDDAAQAEITEKIMDSFKIYVPTGSGSGSGTGTGSGTTHTHAYGTEWKKDANNHWNVCSCGEKANKAAHTDANVDGKCDVCAYNVAVDNNNPQTGDNSMITLWVMLLCVSALGFVATTIYRKKSAV